MGGLIMLAKYMRYEKIKEDDNLAKFFNKIFKELSLLHLANSPFNNSPGSIKAFEPKLRLDMAKLYYESCLFESWLHTVHKKLNTIFESIENYYTEFYGKHEYYAICKRNDSIDEYGAEEDDYLEDGIRKFENKDFEHYSIFSDIKFDIHWFYETTPDDVAFFVKILSNISDFNFFKFLEQEKGVKIPTYRKEDDKFVKNTPQDDLLRESLKEYKAEQMSNMLINVTVELNKLGKIIEEADVFKEDEKKLRKIQGKVSDLLNVKLNEGGQDVN